MGARINSHPEGSMLKCIKYYEDLNLDSLTDDEITRYRLLSSILDLDDDIEPRTIENLTVDQLQSLLCDLKPEKADKPAQPKPAESAPVEPAPVIDTSPQRLEDAFCVRDGRLYRLEVLGGITYTIPCGPRVRFNHRVLSARVVMHYLLTGDLLSRAPRATAVPKPFRARIRSGGRLVHLGYFATAEEREAAVFAYRLGLNNPVVNGSFSTCC